MDTNDENKINITPQNLQIRQGKLLVSDRWLCYRFGIPYVIFYAAVKALIDPPHTENNTYWIGADDLGALMLSKVGEYFTIAQADALASLLRGRRG